MDSSRSSQEPPPRSRPPVDMPWYAPAHQLHDTSGWSSSMNADLGWGSSHSSVPPGLDEVSDHSSSLAHGSSGSLECDPHHSAFFDEAHASPTTNGNPRISSSYYPHRDEMRIHEIERNQSKKYNTVLVEVEPGVHATMRGSDETWEAILSDAYMPVGCCSWCRVDLFAIQDCGYTLCPLCCTINPVPDPMIIDRIRSGLGLGFTFDDLIRWQPEIDQCRRRRVMRREAQVLRVQG